MNNLSGLVCRGATGALGERSCCVAGPVNMLASAANMIDLSWRSTPAVTASSLLVNHRFDGVAQLAYSSVAAF
ncbi:unnamed protein product [Toxocara canis]|uniref:Secreted protein n=1 Tax=Toxocara canis TaxID=6265 RepID=A0A183TXI0_TOXCA|nr:unnamed protein product [Toxocara canis]